MPRLRTLAIILAFVCLLVVAPSAWPAPTLTEFSCDYVFGVNGPDTSHQQIVGWQGSGHNFIGYIVSAASPGGCGSRLMVPGSTSTVPRGISPDNVVVGRYQDTSGVWWAFVMPLGGSLPVLRFQADLSGIAGAGAYVLPQGITVTNLGHAWVVGIYQIPKLNVFHSFALPISWDGNPNDAPKIAGTWISFDILSYGDGSANSVTLGSVLSNGGLIAGSFGNGQGFVMTIANLQTVWNNAGSPSASPVTVPQSQVATFNCNGAVGIRVHGISDVGTVVGEYYTNSAAGVPFYAWPPNTVGATTSVACTLITVPGQKASGQAWAAAISSAGYYIAGQGGSTGEWVDGTFSGY